MSVWAAISLPTSFDPGAIAQPTKDTVELTTRMSFRAWKVSEAEEMTGAKTA